MGHGIEQPGEDELRRLITEQVAGMCGMRPADIDPDRPHAENGLSSRDTVALVGYLETLLDRLLPPTLVWDHPTVSRLASALAHPGGTEPERAADPGPPASGGEADDTIAIVGIGCRFPGGASGTLGDPEAFWNFLMERGDAVAKVPAERWAAFDDGSPATGEALSSATRWAAVLDDIAGFDAAFFGISPAEATVMDPQQRILLEVSWEALEHAGISPRSLRGSPTGVFVGISAAEYAHLTTSDLSRIDAWTATGAAPSVAAGRISYLLDLRGPSLAVDTACSSSLLAVHLAADSLRRRESDLALAGGVNLLLSPVITLTFDAGGGTSPDGRCRPFDAEANGMVRGEGCGVVVLKRLADARRDRDRVLAVIRGSAVNSDGRSNGLVAPNGEAQRDLLRAAHATADADPGQVAYVEAHGTGTPLGDPIEARALGQVLGAGRPEDRPLLIGSVKSNIGHLEAAAGIAGLIKTVLALARGRIPPTSHFTTPSPHIPLSDLGLAVVTQPTAWPEGHRPWVAGVSAFGFSGTNVHVVLAAPAAAGIQAHDRAAGEPAPGRPVPFLLSDTSAERVRDQATELAAWLDRKPVGDESIAAIAQTLDRRRGRGPHRSVIVARDRAGLAAGLGALGSGDPHPAVVTGTDGQAGPGAAFVFSGYGSQWAGMGRELAAAEPVFAGALAELDGPVRDAAGVSLTEVIADPGALRQVQHAQPALFGFQVALARLWEAYGIHPVAVIGHSMGEVAAAVVSGTLSAGEGAHVIACRSRLLSRLAGAGAMALIGLPAEEVTGLAAGLPDVHLAVISSPAQSVVTGDAAQVGELARRASAGGVAARVLQAEGAGHSPQVDPLLDELAAQLTGLDPQPAATRFYSTAHDDPRTPPECDAGYWAANLRRPVRLGPAVAAAVRDGLRTFVEISPHPLLGRALAETVQHETGGPGVITGTLRKCGDDGLVFHAQLARLAASGADVPGPGAGAIIDLPPAPWRHSPYWVDPAPRPGPPGHPLLGPRVELPGGRKHAWRLPVGPDSGLRVGGGGAAVFPLSAAGEMTVAAACEAWDADPIDVTVTGLRLVRLLPLAPGMALTTTLDEAVAAAAAEDRRATVQIHAQDPLGGWRLVATADAALTANPMQNPERKPRTTLGHRIAGVRAARRGRGQRIPAEILDSCLEAARTAPDEIPVSIGVLRVRGPAAAGGHCHLSTVGDGDGFSIGTVGGGTGPGRVTAELRLTTDPGEAGRPLLDALDVTMRRVPSAAIPVPYRDKLLELSWQPRDVPAVRSTEARRWMVLDMGPGPDHDGAAARAPAERLAAHLRAAGHQVDMPAGHPDGSPDAATEDAREVPPAGMAEVAEVAGVARVVLIAPPAPLPPGAAESFVLDVTRVAAWLASRPGPPPRLWLVTSGAVAVRPGEAGDPGLAALRGLVRVLALERPGLRATLVDRDPDAEPEAAAAAMAAEMIADARDDEVSWRDGRRLVARLARASAEPAAGPTDGPRPRRPVVRPGGGYVITGGCGGLGLVVARWLSDRGAGRVVLNGRSRPSAQARTVLDELRGAGTRVRVVLGDIAEPGVAERLVAAARKDGTPLRGIVHAAGVFADALVADIDPGDLSRVWAPKVAGARRLHDSLESTGGAELDWFVLFSSAAALIGSPGQAAYATANAWLDGFAAWRRAQGRPALAINWGVWSEAGRAGDIALPGIDPISPDEGVEALESLLAERRTAAGIIRIDPAAAAAAYPEITDLAFFDAVLNDGVTAAATIGEWPGAEAVRAAEPERRRMLIGQRARSQVAAVLGLPGDQVPPDLALVDAGMDSLAAQRIANLLSRDLAVTVDPGPLLRGATVAQLQESLAAALDAPAGGAALPPPREALPPADGAALPRAALHRAAPRGVEPRDAAERQVARVAADVLGPLAGITDDLRGAGLTEVTQAEIAARLARETGRELDAAALFAVPTVEAAAETVRQAEDAESTGIVRLIRAGGPKAPVLLAHPAGGTTGVYRELAGLLGDDRPVIGLERLGGEVGERSGRYVEAILERFPGGGWVLGGWSFGGVLGYETARQLTAAGHRVALLVLLDAALPLPVPAGSEDRALARRFTAFADYLSRTYGRTVRLEAGELLGLAEDAQLDLVMRRMAEAGLTEQLSPAILRHQHTSHEDTRALERYRAEPYDGPVVLYRAERETPWAVADPRYEITGETRGWDRLCRGLEAAGIDAHHLNLLDPPAVGVVAGHLRALLNRIGGEQ